MTSVHEHTYSSIKQRTSQAWSKCIQEFKAGNLLLPLSRLKETNEDGETVITHIRAGRSYRIVSSNPTEQDDSGFVDDGKFYTLVKNGGELILIPH